MKTIRALALACALTIAPVAVATADSINVCEAIPAADFESALFIKVTQSRSGEGECERFTGMTGVSAQVKAYKREDQKASGAEFARKMTKMGFTVTVLDDTPEVWCARLTAPATMGTAQVFECRAVTQGHYLEVKAMGPHMSRDKAKALVARAQARLP